MYDLTGFQRDLLYVVAGLDKPHGLGIKQELEEYYEKDINHGRLYPNLDTLVEKGFVQKDQKDNRTNEYLLSRQGKNKIKTHVEWKRKYTELGE
jgi:DNA-binding PadR family transcriptional regulator